MLFCVTQIKFIILNLLTQEAIVINASIDTNLHRIITNMSITHVFNELVIVVTNSNSNNELTMTVGCYGNDL